MPRVMKVKSSKWCKPTGELSPAEWAARCRPGDGEKFFCFFTHCLSLKCSKGMSPNEIAPIAYLLGEEVAEGRNSYPRSAFSISLLEPIIVAWKLGSNPLGWGFEHWHVTMGDLSWALQAVREIEQSQIAPTTTPVSPAPPVVVIDKPAEEELDFAVCDRQTEIGWEDVSFTPEESDLQSFATKGKKAFKKKHLFAGGCEKIESYLPPHLRTETSAKEEEGTSVVAQLKNLLTKEEQKECKIERISPVLKVFACFQYYLSILVWFKTISTAGAFAALGRVVQIWAVHGSKTASLYVEKLRKSLRDACARGETQSSLNTLVSGFNATAFVEATTEASQDLARANIEAQKLRNKKGKGGGRDDRSDGRRTKGGKGDNRGTGKRKNDDASDHKGKGDLSSASKKAKKEVDN